LQDASDATKKTWQNWGGDVTAGVRRADCRAVGVYLETLAKEGWHVGLKLEWAYEKVSEGRFLESQVTY
jgi:hypothetical protein